MGKIMKRETSLLRNDSTIDSDGKYLCYPYLLVVLNNKFIGKPVTIE